MTTKQINKIERLLEKYADSTDKTSAKHILDTILEDFYMAGDQDEVVMYPKICRNLMIFAWKSGYETGIKDGMK